MKRRAFLRLTGLAAAAVAAAPMLPFAPAPAPLGISMRMIQNFDAMKSVTRFDVLYGFAALQPQLAVRVWSD